MGLYSVFESAVESQNPLQRIEAAIWESLAAATSCSRHPWNHGAFNTVTMNQELVASVNSRTVILRAADQRLPAIDCHTDVRSQKVADLGSCTAASWIFYDSKSKIQLRISGRADVIDGAVADEAWKETALRSRGAYLSITSPGAVSESKASPSTSDRTVSKERSERGRINFRVVRLVVHRIDWLYLRRTGHLRVKVDYQATNSPKVAWLVP